MTVDISKAPYFDDYDPSKKFMQVLPVPGRALQAREFSQSQTILLETIRRLSDTLLKDGGMVSGMSFTIQNNVLTIEDGRVYLEGVVHEFNRQSINITGVGEENIGVKLIKSIVTYKEDSSLRDPASGYVNYNQPGADRLKGEVVLTVNDPSSPIIYRFLDGQLQVDPDRPQLDIVNDLLARRTYDESGNYRVSGLNLYSEPRDENNINLIVDAGKAYILGYEINKPSSVKVAIPKARDSRLIQNESNYFREGIDKYELGNSPVKQITRVQGEVRVTRERVSRGGQVGGIDFLSKNSISKIERVWQELPDGTVSWEYKDTTDFQLVNSQGVSWSPSGAEPNIGETYYVTYRYNKTMEQGKDYVLTVEGTGSNRKFYVDFTSNLGVDPINDTQFYTDYEFYLARKDLISLNSEGSIIVTRGQSEVARLVSTPVNSNPNILHLGTIYLAPDSEDAVTNSYSITRLSMDDLQKVVKRVEDIEYNQAVTALDDVAMSGESPTNLKGILSDGFFNLSKADVYHKDFNIALSLEDGEIVLPVSNTQAVQPPLNEGTSKITSWGRLITAPMTEEVSIEQPFATGSMLVNPYNVFNKLGVLTLSPEIDNWVDETKQVIEKNTTASYSVHRWWYHGGTLYNDTERYLFNNLQLDAGQSWNGWDNKTGTILSSSARTILDEAVQFMRQTTVTLTAENLIFNTDNLECYFDGVRVDLTPVAGYSAGTIAGTLKANTKGEAKGTFTVPANIRVGTREVVLKNENNMAVGSYTANGRKRVVEETILRTRVTVTATDPLAQSFQFDNDRIVSSVGLYFASKDDNKNCIVQIRNMVNGYPGTEIYGETVVTPSMITASEMGTVETKVSFRDPVMCNAGTQYCVVIETDSDVYSLFIAELGKPTLDSSTYVSRQPYLAGALFSSSNALTWTAHQTQDLKFRVYTAKFAEQGTIEFEPIKNLGADRVVLFSEYLTPANTGCTWEVRMLMQGESGTLESKAYQPIGNYEDTDLGSLASSIQLRATFKSSKYMSPLLALDGISLIGFLTAQNGSYVSRNTVFPEATAYTTVKQVLEASIPNGCTVRPTFSYDGGATWVDNASVVPSVEQVDENFSRYTYVTQVPDGVVATNFRARIIMTSSNSFIRPRARKFMNIVK